MSDISPEEIKKIQEYADKYFVIDDKRRVTMNGRYITLADPKEFEGDKYIHLGGMPVRINGIMRILAEHEACKVEAYVDFDKHAESDVACIGYSEKEQGWLGWSHRAAYIFKVGYVVHKDSLCTMSGWVPAYEAEHPERCFNLPVGFVCKTMDDCRKAAIAFAMAVA